MESSHRPTLPDRSLVSLSFSPRVLVRLLFITIAMLVAIDLALQIIHYRVHEIPWLLKDLFDLDEEQNIPTWYSTAALLIPAWLLLSISAEKKRVGDPLTGYWYGLAIGFFVLSLDECAAIHEAINTITSSEHSRHPFSWAILGAALVIILAVIYMKFLSRIPMWFRIRFMIAGTVYVSGVLLTELVVHEYLKSHDIDSLGYNLISAIEETLEMVGVALFVHSLLVYMGVQALERRATSPPGTSAAAGVGGEVSGG
jgi:hypothetical protein